MCITLPKNTFCPNNQFFKGCDDIYSKKSPDNQFFEGCEEHTDLESLDASFEDYNNRHSKQSLGNLFSNFHEDDSLPVHTRPGWGGCDCG